MTHRMFQASAGLHCRELKGIPLRWKCRESQSFGEVETRTAECEDGKP